MNKKAELKKLLESIPKSYNDFVKVILEDAEEYNAYDQLIEFIKNVPNINSGDVVEFVTIELHGIKPLTDEEKQAYLDSLK